MCEETYDYQSEIARRDRYILLHELGVHILALICKRSYLAPTHKVKAVDILDGVLNEKPTAQKLHN